MTAILATGGLDEAAVAIGLILDFCAFTVAAGLIALSWWKRSLVAVVIAAVIMFAAGLLLQPWKLFFPPPGDDPLWVYIGDFRLMSVVWLLLISMVAACLARVVRARRLKTDASNAA